MRNVWWIPAIFWAVWRAGLWLVERTSRDQGVWVFPAFFTQADDKFWIEMSEGLHWSLNLIFCGSWATAMLAWLKGSSWALKKFREASHVRFEACLQWTHSWSSCYFVSFLLILPFMIGELVVCLFHDSSTGDFVDKFQCVCGGFWEFCAIFETTWHVVSWPVNLIVILRMVQCELLLCFAYNTSG